MNQALLLPCHRMALSVAIGAYLNDGAGDQSGHVRVYTQSGGGGWAQRGSDLDGPGPRSSSGWAVAMSADGTIVAVGAVSASQVNVFIWNGSAWEGMGQTIFGDGVGDGFGVSVALSDDGSIMTAGAFRRSSGQAGHVRVFAWTGADWNQRGNNLVGFTCLRTAPSSLLVHRERGIQWVMFESSNGAVRRGSNKPKLFVVLTASLDPPFHFREMGECWPLGHNPAAMS